MKIGVLAVQGAFIEHIKMFERLNNEVFGKNTVAEQSGNPASFLECIEIRQKNDLENLDAIVLPGGESTVQGKLLKDLEMFEPLKKMIENGTPVLATCAGLILLAQTISNDNHTYLATLPVTVKRNAYGRQLGSFSTVGHFEGIGQGPMTFIRAPYIEKVVPNSGVQILSTVDDKIVAVRYKNQFALSFHPELDKDMRIHEYFVKMVATHVS